MSYSTRYRVKERQSTFQLENLTQPLMQVATKRTAYFKGRGKNDTKKYKVQRFKDGRIFCACPGFLFGWYDQRPCWHVKQAQESWK